MGTGADTAQCKPCHASGTDCRDNGKCCDKSTTCYWKNEHWADCKASCNRGTFDPNSPVKYRAPWSCHPWGTCATPATPNCEFEPYGGTLLQLWRRLLLHQQQNRFSVQTKMR